MTKKCHDCDCEEGELHTPGCDMERCPFCGGQLITCDCLYERFYKDQYKPQEWVHDNPEKTNGHFEGHPTDGLPEEVYKNGPPDKIVDEWDRILEEKGRIPYIIYPYFCAKCGVEFPEMFTVSNEVWARYIEPAVRDKVICRPCFDEIKRLIDEKSPREEE